jgi:hypothetical protein
MRIQQMPAESSSLICGVTALPAVVQAHRAYELGGGQVLDWVTFAFMHICGLDVSEHGNAVPA